MSSRIQPLPFASGAHVARHGGAGRLHRHLGWPCRGPAKFDSVISSSMLSSPRMIGSLLRSSKAGIGSPQGGLDRDEHVGKCGLIGVREPEKSAIDEPHNASNRGLKNADPIRAANRQNGPKFNPLSQRRGAVLAGRSFSEIHDLDAPTQEANAAVRSGFAVRSIGLNAVGRSVGYGQGFEVSAQQRVRGQGHVVQQC